MRGVEGEGAVADDAGRRLLGWTSIALASYVAAEIVNAALADPIGGYHRWLADGGNGNYRLRGQWFFLLVGGWLYLGAPLLGCRALFVGVRGEGLTAVQRSGWIAIALLLFGVVVRLVRMGFLSGAIAWS